jgi:hypothetical protein
VRLERHVGGLGRARQRTYLQNRGWVETSAGWAHARSLDEPYTLSRALHHQLTFDLTQALARWHWRVETYSARGYAQLIDGTTGERRTLPAALRLEARRQGQPVKEFTYALFLNATLVD